MKVSTRTHTNSRQECTRCLRGNPNKVKPREPMDSELSLCEMNTMLSTQRQQSRAHNLRQGAVTTEIAQKSLSLSLYTTVIHMQQELQPHLYVCPRSYLY